MTGVFVLCTGYQVGGDRPSVDWLRAAPAGTAVRPGRCRPTPGPARSNTHVLPMAGQPSLFVVEK